MTDTQKQPEAQPEVDVEAQKAALADLEQRVKGFNGELIPLLGKYQLGLGAVPFITPDGRIFARPQLVDDKKENKPQAEQPAPKVEGNGLAEA